MPSDNNVPPHHPSGHPVHKPGVGSSKPDFMKYPYPETERILAYLGRLPDVKEESRRCITSLLNYRAVRPHTRLPRGPSAAVLVPLFIGRSGDLYVVLSRRSDALRTFAGDTALPGGKVDPQDVTVEDTARREAFEEIGLLQDKERVPLLCVMEPHLAKGEILVTPVVVLILDHGLQPNLNSSEVTSIFAQPLFSFLSSTPHLPSGRTPDPNSPYHSFADIPWKNGGTIRFHKFLTGREGEGIKPVFALTAAILIRTATIAYGRPPEFEVQPPDAPTPVHQIAYALLTPANPLRIACDQEGIDANKAAGRLLCSPVAANGTRTIEWEKIRRRWKKLLRERVDTARMFNNSALLLEDARERVDRRANEVKGDERKLGKAYPKVVGEVERRSEEGACTCNEDGGIKTGKEGIEGVKNHVDDGEEGRGGEEGDWHNPEQMTLVPRKRDIKL